jgi:hypothetical protein
LRRGSETSMKATEQETSAKLKKESEEESTQRIEIRFQPLSNLYLFKFKLLILMKRFFFESYFKKSKANVKIKINNLNFNEYIPKAFQNLEILLKFIFLSKNLRFKELSVGFLINISNLK